MIKINALCWVFLFVCFLILKFQIYTNFQPDRVSKSCVHLIIILVLCGYLSPPLDLSLHKQKADPCCSRQNVHTPAGCLITPLWDSGGHGEAPKLASFLNVSLTWEPHWRLPFLVHSPVGVEMANRDPFVAKQRSGEMSAIQPGCSDTRDANCLRPVVLPLAPI